LSVLSDLTGKQRENAMLNFNSLRFLAYKEKFLAGSWRFLTYFGRDTLLSLRILAPIITPEAFEAEFRGISEHLNSIGEIAHEEDLGDQSAIDQINEWLKSNSPESPVIENKTENDFLSIDSSYLALPLLLDYYYIGGKKLFSSDNSLYVSILKNINFVLSETSTLKPVELRNETDVGDWRDSQSGLAYGRYAFSVNGAMIPAAIITLEKLFKENAWDKKELIKIAEQNNLDHLKDILVKPEMLESLKNHWLEMWKKFHVTETTDNRIDNLNANRRNLEFEEHKKDSNFANGFLALSLDKSENPIPILQSDSLFMLLDFPINEKDKWFNLVCESFEVNVPDGLMSDAGMLVASSSLAPEEYREMFDQNHYHGQVIWAWCQLMLKIALEKQLNKWAVPSPTNSGLNKMQINRLNGILDRINVVIEAHPQFSTSELWTWKRNENKEIPLAYGQEDGNETESNAIQLWSAAALGPQLWDEIRK
jgi:hypothetical protein